MRTLFGAGIVVAAATTAACGSHGHVGDSSGGGATTSASSTGSAGSTSSTGSGGAPAGPGSSSSSTSSTSTSSTSSSSTSGTGGAGGSPAVGCASLVPPVPTTSGPSIHVAGNGSDTTGDGSLAKPYATLGRALSGAVAGTHVYLGGGGFCHMKNANFDATYCPTKFMSFAVNGTAAEPIVITAEPGQSPVIDLSLLPAAAYASEAGIIFHDSSHVVVDGIEIQNSPYAGITFGGKSSFCTLTRSKVHDVQQAGVQLMGSDFIVAGNELYDLALANTGATPSASSWPGCNVSWFASGDTSNPMGWTERVQWLANDVHDCWGEGIIALFADTVDIIGNRIVDTFSHKIYVDHGANVRILRNTIFQATPGTYGTTTGPNAGVGIDDEHYPWAAYVAENDILIANNYFGPNLRRILFRFDTNTGPTANANKNNTWSNVHFVFNVVEPAPFVFAKVLGDTTGLIPPTGGVVAGNVFLGQPSFQLGDPGAWVVANNAFVGGISSANFGGEVPTLMNNLDATPGFVGPTDGSTLAGFVLTNPASFQVPYDASLVQMPSSMPNYTEPTFLDQESLVLQDYQCKDRGGATTTAGVSAH